MAYRIVRQLPSGGFSEIFEVEDAASALPERLILKRLNAEMSALPRVRAAFAAEAQLLRDLKHPHVVTFRRCYYDEDNRICLLMEKVSGEPLDVWARRHAARADEVLDLFDRLLLAVDYLHHRPTPFLHLDLKPDNVLVVTGSEGRYPVLIDFGIARRAGESGLKAYTPPYGAPEQERGGRLGTASDVYALGQILAELLALAAATAPAAGTPGSADGPLRQVAARAASGEARRRYADAGEMRLAFRRARLDAARSTPAARTHGGATVAAAARWARRRGVWLAAGGGALALLTTASVLLSRGPAPPAAEHGPPPGAAARDATGEQPEARPSELEARFASLQFRFEESVLQGRCSLTDAEYLELNGLATAAP
jgi:Protein kinase domain